MTPTPQTTAVKPPSLAPALAPWFGAIFAWSLAAALILRPTLSPEFKGFTTWQDHLALRLAALATATLLCGWLFVRTRRTR